MGAEAPIFTGSLWSFRSFSWGNHSFTLISDLGLPISTVDLSPQRSAFRFPTSDCRFRPWTSALRGRCAFCAHRMLAFQLPLFPRPEDPQQTSYSDISRYTH